MKKYRYEYHSLLHIDDINKLASDGWKLHSFSHIDGTHPGAYFGPTYHDVTLEKRIV